MESDIHQSLIDQYQQVPKIKISLFRRNILKWYKAHGRSYPWRNTNDPFKTIIAEIFLQQTNADNIVAVYNDFVDRYPSPYELATAKPSSVQRYISKIGLNYKTARIIGIAQIINDIYDGSIPPREGDIMQLPGVGRYITNAVLCNAFNKKKALLDTNIIRIISRYLSIHSHYKRPRMDPQLWEISRRLLPHSNAKCRMWNYSVLDYCALVCKHNNPRCANCVCFNHCDYGYKLLAE